MLTKFILFHLIETCVILKLIETNRIKRGRERREGRQRERKEKGRKMVRERQSVR
jgi:hypothetical protein